MSPAGNAKPRATSSPTIVRAQQAFKTALSLVLLYWLALWMNWDMPKYGALAVVLISLDTTGASLHKGVMRMVGTTVGLVVGFLGLALFAQSCYCNLLFLASYLVIVGYGVQTSRYPYAWFVAGFLPPLVWSTTYGDVGNAFHYATFRYLETSAGVVIYTLVTAVLWPRQAGDQLTQQGATFCAGLRKLFGFYCRHLRDGEMPTEAAELRSQIAGTAPKMLATLEAAYADTPSVIAKKRAWEAFRVNGRAVGDVLELWRQCIDDCRRFDLDRLLPPVASALETLDRRFARIDQLWNTSSAQEEVTSTDDDLLLGPMKLAPARDLCADLSHRDRGALLSFVQQLNVLDIASRELLRTIRVLAGLAPIQDVESPSLPSDLYRPSGWDAARLLNGMLPALCFTAAYFFWIYFDPPTGPSVPNMAATFGLLVLMTPMNVLVLIPIVLVAIWGIVAPIYFFVMPRLSTGPELLTLIFCFAFVVGLFRGRLGPLKTMSLVMFVMMTGISNQQSYSFLGLVDAALMMMLGVGAVAVVQTLLCPLRAEQALLQNARRFFSGCARVAGGFALDGSPDPARGRRIRKQYLESMVVPAPAKIRATQKHLDYSLFPDNSPEKVQRLIDGMQGISYRLQSLEIAHKRLSRHASQLPKSFITLGSQARSLLQRVFERWAAFEPADELERTRSELQHLSQDLEHQLDTLDVGRGGSQINDEMLTDLYTMMGSVRGLIDVMASAQGAINQINWRQWAAARF